MEQDAFQADPEQLRAEAEKEAPRRGLQNYVEAIRLLKEEKAFSFREIATWLQERGLNVDHNAVWRAYSRAISNASDSTGYERNEQYERKAPHGGAMPWLDDSSA